MARRTITISSCVECGDWLPSDSYGCGTICAELMRHVSMESDCEIPDWCPRLAKQAEAQAASANRPNAPFVKKCTCGKRIATVHLCDECFRDAAS